MMIRRDVWRSSAPVPTQRGAYPYPLPIPTCHTYPVLQQTRLGWAQGHTGSQVGIIVVVQQVKLVVLAFSSSAQRCLPLPGCPRP